MSAFHIFFSGGRIVQVSFVYTCYREQCKFWSDLTNLSVIMVGEHKSWVVVSAGVTVLLYWSICLWVHHFKMCKDIHVYAYVLVLLQQSLQLKGTSTRPKQEEIINYQELIKSFLPRSMLWVYKTFVFVLWYTYDFAWLFCLLSCHGIGCAKILFMSRRWIFLIARICCTWISVHLHSECIHTVTP